MQCAPRRAGRSIEREARVRVVARLRRPAASLPVTGGERYPRVMEICPEPVVRRDRALGSPIWVTLDLDIAQETRPARRPDIARSGTTSVMSPELEPAPIRSAEPVTFSAMSPLDVPVWIAALVIDGAVDRAAVGGERRARLPSTPSVTSPDVVRTFTSDVEVAERDASTARRLHVDLAADAGDLHVPRRRRRPSRPPCSAPTRGTARRR